MLIKEWADVVKGREPGQTYYIFYLNQADLSISMSFHTFAKERVFRHTTGTLAWEYMDDDLSIDRIYNPSTPMAIISKLFVTPSLESFIEHLIHLGYTDHAATALKEWL